MRNPPLSSPPPLVAVAHGSRDPRATATVEGLLDLVRARGVNVLASYLDHAAPSPVPVLTGLRSAVVLPLLLTAAYHSKIDIPDVLARARSRNRGLAVRVTGTLGPHPLLLDALERRLAEVDVVPSPDTGVVLVSAGSSDPSANAVIASMARAWRRRGWYDVRPAYASATSPTPADAVHALYEAGAPKVVVASYFLAPGYFADKVRTAAEEAGARAVSPVLGAAPELADIVVERYRDALALRPVAARRRVSGRAAV
ncbi:sirohydrochlorin chelatase [Actinocorallia sp. API 0066]|uniref:sirohydrochlorin chelatase n=1 Tax=Actinocorallia sp. API 0066 TaxID=2896846 RepID=UPI001E5CCCB9|nr:sirohydrochlorin chelatase [Actinocorallia sp. API 0066]MCD0448554.1 sirohydrochlorin chelatase [Actinocorallia sp. API 0066]